MLELPKYLKTIFSKKDFKFFCQQVIKNKQEISNTSDYPELFNLIIQINKINSKYNDLYLNGILYKMSYSHWIFFSKYNEDTCNGFIAFRNKLYYFTENYEYILSSLKKYRSDISQDNINKIKELAMLGYKSNTIEFLLKLNKRIINSVLLTYKEEINEGFKKNFINSVIENYGESTEQIRAKSKLEISKKEFAYCLNIYKKDIDMHIKNKFVVLEDIHSNNKLRLKCPFKNGLINGEVRIYDTSEKLCKVIDFIEGQINGNVKVYDNNRKTFSVRKVTSHTKNVATSITNKENPTEKDLYENALKLCWEVLEFIPEKYKTEENCLLALEQNVLSLKYFPEKYKTKSICDKCINTNIYTYVYVPDEFKTKENTELFFEQYNKSLEHIPKEFITEEMCKIAFLKSFNNIEYIPNKYKTFEMCQKAVEHNGELLAQVPKEFINEEVCLMAVKQNGLSIKYVPENYKNQSIIVEAVKQNYRAISLVSLQNNNDLALLIKSNKELFKHLPPQVRNQHICTIALHQDIDNIRYIPAELLTEDMCKYFLRKVHKKKFARKKHFVDTIKNRLNILQIGIAEKKSTKNIISKSNNITLKTKEIESYDDIINNYKYKNKTDLVPVENPHDKIFNFTLIKNRFENKYTDFVGKLSNINKNSSNLKVKTKYKDIYYIWSFRKDELEILLEFSNNNVELTKYFNSLEKELRREFDKILILGQTKTKTVLYISTVKFSIDWAINTMYKFISIFDKKLSLFYNGAINNNLSDNDYNNTANNTEDNAQEYFQTDEPDDDIAENDIFEEHEYVHLNIVDGQTTTVKLTRYERNPKNRAEAIKIHGTTCLACGFNFNDFYGKDLAKDFIEVHHIKPVSQGEYTVNPKTDLVPLCSNCHSMIHKEKNPPKTIEEIRNRYKRY